MAGEIKHKTKESEAVALHRTCSAPYCEKCNVPLARQWHIDMFHDATEVVVKARLQMVINFICPECKDAWTYHPKFEPNEKADAL